MMSRKVGDAMKSKNGAHFSGPNWRQRGVCAKRESQHCDVEREDV